MLISKSPQINNHCELSIMNIVPERRFARLMVVS
jgi:hypothetical protein